MRVRCDGDAGRPFHKCAEFWKGLDLVRSCPRTRRTGCERGLAQVGNVELIGEFDGGECDASGAVFGCRIKVPYPHSIFEQADSWLGLKNLVSTRLIR